MATQSNTFGSMLELGPGNKVLKEGIEHRVEAAKKEPCDAKLYDFDDVFYRLFIDPDDRSKMLVSMEVPNWADTKDKGGEELMKIKLGDYLKECTNDGCKFEISLEDEKSAEQAEDIAMAFSKLRIYALGGPLYKYLKALQDKKPEKDPFTFKFRNDTHMWIVPKADRLTVVFAFEFPIKADRIIANQVLYEFIEVRRQRDVQNTPVISFSPKDPPKELEGQELPAVNKDAFLGYFSVLLLPSHIQGNKLEMAVENVIGFRAYLTYHIKCAKAYFHQSMRARVKDMLQILNRARYEPDDQRKKKKIIVGAN